MTISIRIKKLRDNLNLSQEELAEKIGVQRNTVWRWENGKASPMESIRAIAFALNTSVAYLLGETDDPSPKQRQTVESNVAPINPVHMIRVRILDKFYRACCGVGVDWLGEAVDFEETLWLPSAELAQRYGNDDLIGIYAEGDSMEDMIYEGDLVIFVPHEKSVVYAGVPMVVSYNGSMIIRGVIENSGGLTLRAKNRDYEDIRVTNSDEFDICGRVVTIHSIRKPTSVL
jgi:transcriptional regulator with XRE-family HTH domain